jgi:F420-non-reducing hydrogenase large subunit
VLFRSAHHLAATLAVEVAWGITPPRPAVLLRELLLHLAHLGDKLLHLFFLAGPDFFPEAAGRPGEVGLWRAEPGAADLACRARALSRRMLETLAGQATHPTLLVPGGLARPMGETERLELRGRAGELAAMAEEIVAWARLRLRPGLERRAEAEPGPETGFLAALAEDGALSFTGRLVRLQEAGGGTTDFRPEEYLTHLEEGREPDSYGRPVYLQGRAGAAAVYRVGPLARLNLAEFIPTPLAQAELAAFQARHGRPVQAAALTAWARLIEVLYSAERIVELLTEPALADPQVRTPARPAAGRGVGWVEASRGSLSHDYLSDAEGRLSQANLVTPTNHNLAALGLSLTSAARGGGERLSLRRMEAALRDHDP